MNEDWSISLKLRDWSSNQLLPSYARSIAGFDIRRFEVDIDDLRGPERSYYHERIRRTRKYPLSIDENAWPCIEGKEDLAIQQNGLLFFNLPHESLIQMASQSLCVLVAIDIPTAIAQILEVVSGVNVLPLEVVSEDQNWVMLGYDFADVINTMSALYGVFWDKDQMPTFLAKNRISLNPWGLEPEQSEAIRASLLFDEEISEHAPFAPCGVWVWGAKTPSALAAPEDL
ncbi:hypothetical protein DGI_2444 [Megalodesulfovibrio gigas DSM 1382 = ATCC 19364]|uniref:Uncharacterized protein n=1 Tax=Megalodesulfovibrio gigas (strain ATCC 19364 / DSM 1382 / NCIMB 9332 / VKM B-1759) TaxID=1121448 RepID=T2GD15_MEGG1|nr:hypothetical protein DGI_2444 [Megalodesulfovibrio gigas DSM 1382 = ATCC 19364]